MNRNKPYFYQSFTIVVLSIAAFAVFKQFLPRKIFPETTVVSKNIVIDSLALEAVQAVDTTIVDTAEDTLREKKIVFKKQKGIQFPPEDFEDYRGYQHLIAFYEKLLQLETKDKGKVRIAYFGDSMTDGDLVVKDFRAKLQERFGGMGVGFVNITSESASSRSTLKHEFSNNWKTVSYLNVKHPESPFGITGQVFFTKHDTVNPAWVKYRANRFNNLLLLNDPTLFYGKSENKEGEVVITTGKDTIVKALEGNKLLNTITIAPYDLKAFKAEFIATDSIPFYGFNFDDGKGVHVDNFSSRGNSGLPISIFNPKVMQAFNKELGYDLIVLHYGANVLNYGTYNYSWYEKRMKTVVKHIRECFPGVAILIVSTADKSTKYDMEMKTDSAVMPLALSQKRYAVQSDAAFVNLYTLMGGEGSMVKWVEEVPALANKDYTHFNFRGSEKIGGLIYEQINQGYEQYKKMKGIKQPKPKTQAAKKDSLKRKNDSTHAE
ncbi:hypothetical protein E0W68_00330 [Flavobacterium salilacus subsp. salilacus]|uniref:hypothetical protein n=1 Tax=Flavobacterium TaxID=237 RepID=UPI001074C995|nr:hypothetical protein [Flavobacterium salilacus]KAF2519718.1 hypothetical protein E0W68_00330 [Flavobacterium salilacus subsp. salilacus]MBE1614393.1 hypothetical protein [Flavobacterium sp. SaA2.13]